MVVAPSRPKDAPRARWTAFLGRVSGRAVAVALLFGALSAVALNHYFITAFPVLLGRFLFLSLVLLLAFSAAGQWQQNWLPRWLMQVLAVAVSAPLATAAVYLLSSSGNLWGADGSTASLRGFMWISGTGVVIGLVLALGALYRERDAQARSQQLQFELERNQLERQALDARLSLLQAQIEPHFLFNTLANVQALVESGSPRAPAVLSSLIAYLRAAMPRLHESGNTLGQELALVRAYLELMHMRMPDRLSFTLQVDETLHGRRFPPMALLTLVENAVRHGIDPSEQGGRIEVGAQADGGTLRLWVLDTGMGLPPQASEGTGLGNLRERLAAFFGGSARLQLDAAEPHGLRAQIIIESP